MVKTKLEALLSYLEDELLVTPDLLVSKRIKEFTRKRLIKIKAMPDEECSTCELATKKGDSFVCDDTGFSFVSDWHCKGWELKDTLKGETKWKRI